MVVCFALFCLVLSSCANLADEPPAFLDIQILFEFATYFRDALLVDATELAIATEVGIALSVDLDRCASL